MSEPRSKDLQYAILFGMVVMLALFAVIDPFGTGSFSSRTVGGIVIGPLSICYAFYGLSKGRFPEFSRSVRAISPLQFWLCFWAFLIMGGAVALLGLKAIATAT
jgi:hypothetical protein